MLNTAHLVKQIKQWALELGFNAVGISDTQMNKQEARLLRWLNDGMHGEMQYMQAHGTKRSRPQELVPGTLSIISVRMNYLPADSTEPEITLDDPKSAYIARYALGRDYHKLMRKRLVKLAERIEQVTGKFGYRAFADSAPVLEKTIAEKAGLGWIGKNTLLLNRHAGSYFFLGELYTDLSLPTSKPDTNHCGTCHRCIDVCPTDAIVEPYQLDARRCIAYLTIELHGSIPIEFRPLIGNRVFGCDDCQIVCPWNRYAKAASDPAFTVKNRLDKAHLIDLFLWSESEFLDRSEGTVLRRLGYERWLRNLAVGLGNAPYSKTAIIALNQRRNYPSDMVKEHIDWAVQRQKSKAAPLI